PFDLKGERQAVEYLQAVQRHRHHDARPQHARDRLQPLLQPAEPVGPLRRLPVFVTVQTQPQREDVARVKARVNLTQAPEAPDEQPGPGEQHERKRDLGHDERAAHPPRGAVGRGGRAFLERSRQIDSGDGPRGREAEQPSTRASSRTSSSRGRSPGPSASSASTPHAASNTPQTPPATASSRLSVSNCRMTRQRPAPSATRTAISRRRTAPRASSRPATLTHATASTQPTAPSSTKSGRRKSPVSSRMAGMTRAPVYLLVSGYCARNAAVIASSSACACPGVTLGFNR